MKDNYIVPVHPRPGTETPHELNAPSFYLLDRYLKAKATELFDVAHSQGLPVLQTGRYQNLTYNIKVSSQFSILKNFKIHLRWNFGQTKDVADIYTVAWYFCHCQISLI